jgi:hypothetical protein
MSATREMRRDYVNGSANDHYHIMVPVSPSSQGGDEERNRLDGMFFATGGASLSVKPQQTKEPNFVFEGNAYMSSPGRSDIR